MGELASLLLILIAAGILCFYLALSETALLSLSRDRVDEWKEQGKSFAETLDQLLENRKKLLNLLDFLQALSSALYFSVLTIVTLIQTFQLFSDFLVRWIYYMVAGFLVYSFLLQFFPRQLAHDHVEGVARSSTGPIGIIFRLLGWIGPLLDRSSVLLASLFGREPVSAKQPALSDEEIKMMVRLGKEEPLEIEKEEKEMIESVMTFGQTLVKEIMTPRIDMVCVDSSKNVSEVLDVAMSHGHSKFPVYEGTIDNIVGIAYTKDLFRLYRDGKQAAVVKEALKKPFFVPESKKVDDLLRDMQKEKTSMAIVVDEYGGTDGLVTIEDLVEEIVGEIADEHDKVPPPILHMGERTWLVDGRINIEDLNAQLELTLPHEEFETLGGYVYGLMGKVPKAGDKVETENVILEVTEVHRQRISKVKVVAKAPVEARENEENKA